ncbi:UNKNOWN [Stylonychia lemnae]|uniref:Uncharacterized protein n=1 Tax=Stylonychia lemnae TaxID=5949 RepID=A0A078AWC4_STYLE|nr:UNKNOWN [Stylonychia lemnae]|eukprot:CDW85103.1 UNKNOWN [Stylonychia lemnae]
MGVIIDIETMEIKYRLDTKVATRCCVKANNLLICGLDSKYITVYNSSAEYRLVQTISGLDLPPARAMDVKDDLLLIGFFATLFHIYKVNEESIQVLHKVNSAEVQFSRFLDSKYFVVTNYGQGFQWYNYKNKNQHLAIRPMQKISQRYLKKTKINDFIKLSKQKYLLLDWDRQRYIIWNQKKKSYRIVQNQDRVVQKVLCGSKLKIRYPVLHYRENLQKVDNELISFPFVLCKQEKYLVAINYENMTLKSVGKSLTTSGLLNQKLIKLKRQNEFVEDTYKIQFMTTSQGLLMSEGELVKIELDVDKMLEMF